MSERDLFQEANRQLVICNACRYCEGYCAVFQSMVKYRSFNQGDILYFSNLCHDCRACYYACMYTPPHEFAINIPKVLSEVRLASYKRWSWPALLASAFSRESLGLLLGSVVAVIVVIAAFLLIPSERMFGVHSNPGAFYEVIPYAAMVIPAMVLFFYGVALWLRGSIRSWSEAGRDSGSSGLQAVRSAISAALSLRYLKGGGPGCYYPEQKPTGIRRFYHSLTFWGFASAFVSTTLAFIYQDFLHLLPPYSLSSAPVLFGAIGGVSLIIGTLGLIWYKVQSDRAPKGDRAYGMDYVFLIMLLLTALTGELTLILRATSNMGLILTIHLAVVAGLFVTMPYGKFVHFVYRTLALVRFQIEQPLTQVAPKPRAVPAVAGLKPDPLVQVGAGSSGKD